VYFVVQILLFNGKAVYTNTFSGCEKAFFTDKVIAVKKDAYQRRELSGLLLNM
jgi:hypothetical protein